MLTEALVAYAHVLSILLLGMCLAYELILYRRGLALREARLLLRIDLLYLFAALAVLASGLLRVFAVGKGSAFYLDNPVFYAKLALFLGVALLSLPPTFHYLRWRPALAAGQAPEVPEPVYRRIRRYLHAEMTLFLLIPLLAALLARGIGK
jgi:putative membrane protein